MNTRKGLFNWPLTAAGKHAILPCPKDPHCYATRHWWVLLHEVKVLGSKSCYRKARFLTLLPVHHQQTVDHYTLDEARPGPVSHPGGNHPWSGPHPSYSWSVLFFRTHNQSWSLITERGSISSRFQRTHMKWWRWWRVYLETSPCSASMICWRFSTSWRMLWTSAWWRLPWLRLWSTSSQTYWNLTATCCPSPTREHKKWSSQTFKLLPLNFSSFSAGSWTS